MIFNSAVGWLVFLLRVIWGIPVSNHGPKVINSEVSPGIPQSVNTNAGTCFNIDQVRICKIPSHFVTHNQAVTPYYITCAREKASLYLNHATQSISYS